MTTAQRLEALEKQGVELKMTTSHTKRTSLQNGKKIDGVVKKVDEIHEEFMTTMADLKGDKGYLKQIDKNTKEGEERDLKIERNTFKLDKTQTLLIRIGIGGAMVGAVFMWLFNQYKVEKLKDVKSEIILYHKPFEYGISTKILQHKSI